MEQEDWATRIGTCIAKEIRRHRLASGMSAQQLSEACAKVGAPIPRTVISNIENGRRTNVSVAEVVVLARALGVPPVALIYPAGYESEVEYLPGRRTDSLRAIRWFSGETEIGEKTTLDSGPRDDWALTVVRRHRSLENRISGIYKGIFEETIDIQREPVGPEADAAREHALRLSRELKALRAEMLRRGLKPPKTYLNLDLVSDEPLNDGGGHWSYTGETPF